MTATPAGGFDPVRWAQWPHEHGRTVDDPDPSEPGGGKPAPSGPQFDQVWRECAEKVPGVVVPEN